MRRAHASALFLAILLLGGCGDASAPAEPQTVTVFAAASLSKPFSEAAPGLLPQRVRYSFAGSQALVTQITEGAPADVVATADEASMAKLVEGRLVEAPVIFAANRIVMAVAKGNPKQITTLSDLGRADVAVVLADPSVPVGAYARRALDAAGTRVTPKSLELDTNATLGRVTSGDADAAIVYVTDVRASTATEAIDVPETSGVTVRYPIAIVRATKHRAAAERFVESVRSGVIHEALVEAGFT